MQSRVEHKPKSEMSRFERLGVEFQAERQRTRVAFLPLVARLARFSVTCHQLQRLLPALQLQLQLQLQLPLQTATPPLLPTRRAVNLVSVTDAVEAEEEEQREEYSSRLGRFSEGKQRVHRRLATVARAVGEEDAVQEVQEEAL